MEWDEYVKQISEKYSLSLIHVSVKVTYNTNVLKVLFRQKVKLGSQLAEMVVAVGKVAPPSIETNTMETQPPACLKYGTPIALRWAAPIQTFGKVFSDVPISRVVKKSSLVHGETIC
jgi:hypothetical protein